MSKKPSQDNILTGLEYKVLFEKGTEPPFSHPFNEHHQKGVYVCKNCQNPLFKSDSKFNSGSGWPSFFQSIDNHIGFNDDISHNMNRTEITCGHCGCHLGHVFDDGPEPTGLRYCVNGSALDFHKDI